MKILPYSVCLRSFFLSIKSCFEVVLYIHISFMYLACDATWYGAGCKFQCGHCIGEDNCHHVNGSCLLGCQKGFTGDLCFNRKWCICVLLIIVYLIQNHGKSYNNFLHLQPFFQVWFKQNVTYLIFFCYYSQFICFHLHSLIFR